MQPKNNMTKISKINYLNIFLIFISLITAYIIPFKLFLISYAILGPLHYITEISWLEKRNYFIKNKYDAQILIFIACLILITMISPIFTIINSSNLLFLAFIYALIIIFIENITLKSLAILTILTVSIIFNFKNETSIAFILFAILLPTIIHVFLFTGAFILLGYLKDKDKSGIILFISFISAAALCLLYKGQNLSLNITNQSKELYVIFKSLNQTLYQIFGFGQINNLDTLYNNENSIAIMRFIAFSYTYHYLNWFSKINIIKWSQVSKKRLGVIILLWVLSLVIYYIDYKIGFTLLLLLSIAHVILEFPLNHLTFIEIGKKLTYKKANPINY